MSGFCTSLDIFLSTLSHLLNALWLFFWYRYNQNTTLSLIFVNNQKASIRKTQTLHHSTIHKWTDLFIHYPYYIIHYLSMWLYCGHYIIKSDSLNHPQTNLAPSNVFQKLNPNPNSNTNPKLNLKPNRKEERVFHVHGLIYHKILEVGS